MKNYLVIGGTHGNEPLGIEVCKRLEKLNLTYIDILYANKKAIKSNKRFVEEDLNRAFPGAKNGSYEKKRANRIYEICKKYDYIIDFHNTNCPANDCGFVGGTDWKNSTNLSLFLGLNKVIIADYNCVNKYVKNCLSVEISLSSKKFDIDYWVEKMISLKNFKENKNYGKARLFQFKYRITSEEQNKLNFPKWKAFRKISRKYVKKLNLNGEYYPIFIDDAYTPYNYAGLISKLSANKNDII